MRKFVFMLIIFLTTFGAVHSAFGSADKSETYTYYEEVCVAKGESYWDIAGKFASDGMSRNEYAEYIMEFNGTINNELKAGQRIIVPVIKYI